MIRQMAVCASLAALLSGCTVNDDYPAMTADGLPRVEDGRLDAVYWQEGANWAGYDKVLIETCEVTFRDNWQRDQNSSRSINRSVSDDDMDRIRERLAERFNEIFVAELTEGDAFEIVTEPGPGVLRLQPRIVDLDVYAPDIFDAGRRTVVVTEAGRMTLDLGLADAESGESLGRIIDRRRARYYSDGRVANSVTNRLEADVMIRRWAQVLKSMLTVSS